MRRLNEWLADLEYTCATPTICVNRQYEVSDYSNIATNISTMTLMSSFIKIDERKRVLESSVQNSDRENKCSTCAGIRQQDGFEPSFRKMTWIHHRI